MLSKVILAAGPQTEWAVLNRGVYVRKEQLATLTVSEASCTKVRLHSSQYYEYDEYKYASKEPDAFTKAAPTARGGKGFLVVDSEGYFRVVRATHFVAQWEQMAARWKAESARKAAVEEEFRRQESLRASKTSEAQQLANEQSEQISKALAAFVRPSGGEMPPEVHVGVAGGWEDEQRTRFETRLTGTVRLDFRMVRRLLQRLQEAEEG